MQRNRIDAIFAADQWSATGLLTLRILRMNVPPIVVLVHHPPTTRWQRSRLRAADRLVALGPRTQDAILADLGLGADLLPWGPDESAAVYHQVSDTPQTSYDFIAAGRTNRDYRALADLAKTDGLNGVILDGAWRRDFRGGDETRQRQSETYAEIIQLMKRARFVVVPLADSNVMSGLTEVADALAMRIPIIATASAASPFDIEAHAAGVVASENNTISLREAFMRAGASTFEPAQLLADHNLSRYEAELDRILLEVAARR